MESWPGITATGDGSAAYVSFSNQIYRVNADGAETWRFAQKPNARVTFYAPPAISEDGNLLVGAYNHLFYKIKPEGDQSIQWTFTGAKDRFIASPLIQGDIVYAPSADGHLYALRQTDGTKVWDFAASHALWSTPIPDGERLYVASMDHHVYALDPATGRVMWTSDDLGGPIVAAPALSSDGVLYTAMFGSKSDDPALTSKLVALDSASGKTLWTMPLKGWVWATPLLSEDTLYLGDTAGYFYAIDIQQHTPRWTYPASGAPADKTSILGGSAIIGDKIYFGNEAGVITILNRADGTAPLQITVGGQIYSNLVVAGDLIWFAPINNKEAMLVGMRPDGTIAWKFLPGKEAPTPAAAP
jgi:outer membrane protein assembly factor BamB